MTNLSTPTTPTTPGPMGAALGEGLAALRDRWGWIVGIGVLLSVLGLVALGSVVTATVASVWVVGVAMMIGGAAEVANAFAMKSWGKFFLWALVGLLYGVAGVFAILNPLLAAGVLTLFLGAGLVAAGIMRIILAFQMTKCAPWIWAALSGVITALLGAVILMKWPVSSLFALGVFLGVDLLFAGASWIGVGLALRRGREA
jgi:uncharacterized membrane protein HdeD (DUF308 family)